MKSPTAPMYDCFGGTTGYGFVCDVRGAPAGSCLDYDIAPDLCPSCEKSVQAAKEQQEYLKQRKQNDPNRD